MTRDGETGIRFVGVDVCKSHLDTFVDGRREQVKRSSLEFERWLRTECRDGASVHVIVEATAGYEQVVVEACEAVDVACSRVNPNRVKHFARARGRLAKTDRMDAETLALFGEAMRPAACRASPYSVIHRRVHPAVRPRRSA